MFFSKQLSIALSTVFCNVKKGIKLAHFNRIKTELSLLNQTLTKEQNIKINKRRQETANEHFINSPVSLHILRLSSCSLMDT